MLITKNIIYLQLIFSVNCLIVKFNNITLSQPLELRVNNTIEYILQYEPNETGFPLRVSVESLDASSTAPLLVVVRQKLDILSWKLPLNVDENSADLEFNKTSRTLCYDHLKLTALDNNKNAAVINDHPIITISTSSMQNVTANVNVDFEKDYFVKPNVLYKTSVTPSETRFYFYDFPANKNISDNTETVVLEVTSEDNICMIISIQNATCPIYDLNNNIKFEGYYETANRKGGVTISKSKFPDGFFMAFVPKANDYDCTGEINSLNTQRNKTFEFIIKPSISRVDYINAIIATVSCILIFYVIFGVGFFMCSNRVYIPRTMEFMSNSALNTPVSTAAGADILDNISSETEYDTVAEAMNDREIILSKPVVYLSDLARKDFRILKKKSYSYLWHVLTIALFYGLPVVQLVITYQKVLNDTGNQDLCYYNFLCAHPLGIFSDFNHLLSNIGYIAFGLLYILIVYRREKWHKDNYFDQVYGIPQHYGLFYALGVALCMEGVLSGSYHICPNHSNFQFDTSFMYIMAVLCMVKIYQTRHPDINATAYSTFGVLAVAILIGMVGILEPTIYFRVSFAIIHIATGLYLTAQIYYMGCWTLDRNLICRLFRVFMYDFQSGHFACIKPTYKGRFILLLMGNICNWLVAAYGLYHNTDNFAILLLLIFMMNTMLYFIFYIVMKLLHKERINLLAWLFMVISFTCAGVAMYCFLNKSISWALTPALSRQFNQECKLMNFYDYHDIWHFLSAIGMFFIFMVLLLLDDDLSHVHRSKIPVF